MPKESGIGVTLSIDESGGTARDVSNDVGETNIDTPAESHDVTGLDSSAHERVYGLHDFQASITGYFNDTSQALFDVLKTAGSTTATRTFSWTLSAQILAVETLLTRCTWGRSRAAEMSVQATFELQSGDDPTWTT